MQFAHYLQKVYTPAEIFGFKQRVYRVRGPANRQLLLQAIISLVCAAIALFSNNIHDAYSALLAGIVVIIPTYLFIKIVFSYSGARAAGKILGSFMVGEICKLLVMAVLIVLVFKFIPVEPAVFLLSFLAVQFGATTIAFWQSNRQASVEVKCKQN